MRLFSARLVIIYVRSKNSSNRQKNEPLGNINLSSVTILSVERCPRRRVVQLHATPLLVRRVRERQLPASFSLRRSEPQTHEMSARRRWGIVRVRCAAVQRVCIAEELDVADLKDHVQ